MISAKKKKIYIGIITLCIVGMFFVFTLSGRSPVADIPFDPTDPAQFVPGEESDLEGDNGDNFEVSSNSGDQTFSPPSVFPADGSFDLSIFESSTFKALSPVADIILDDNEIGKENPFK